MRMHAYTDCVKHGVCVLLDSGFTTFTNSKSDTFSCFLASELTHLKLNFAQHNEQKKIAENPQKPCSVVRSSWMSHSFTLFSSEISLKYAVAVVLVLFEAQCHLSKPNECDAFSLEKLPNRHLQTERYQSGKWQQHLKGFSVQTFT